MYKKIWGLQQLEIMGFLYPPYQIVAINEDKPSDIEKYILQKIKLVGIPNIAKDRIGVTIRVSLPGNLDKVGKHGGLHLIDEKDILKRVLQKHEQYKPLEKIILQHTVDAKCSGVTMKDGGRIIIETIPGDAPPLLQGETSNFESWIYLLDKAKWIKERSYVKNNREVQILSKYELNKFIYYIKKFVKNIYLEWSIAKNGIIYFYEYLDLSQNVDDN